MDGFSEAELAYLRTHDLARLATATAAGAPHVVPVRIHLGVERNVIGIGSFLLAEGGRPRRYRHNVQDNDQVALVVDDFTEDGPRGVAIHGVGRIHAEGGERLNPRFEPVWLAIMPTWISSWGVDTSPYAPPFSRWVAEGL
ncbi:pyridoxamine 5'-phosphate oxidase family protein [Nonomuraea sp. LPB2021202275-12-8]|uniref:pyridoxamine 5'-phosphate oxidase family protein n=1 Tax=Nonomuraea sp. LPB2021202275-12-8 TaxID=3120159 RepID=UPI00300C55D2